MTRREFLQLALSVPLTPVLGACAWGDGTSKAQAPMLLCFGLREWRTLDGLAAVFWPAGAGRPDGRTVGVARACDRLFAQAHPGLQHELRQALWLWEWGPYLHGEWRPFSELSSAAQARYAERWRLSGVGIFRRVYVALQRLCAMVYHMQPDTWGSMGYGGPWVGRIDVGLGRDNQGAMSANPNPNVFAVWGGDRS